MATYADQSPSSASGSMPSCGADSTDSATEKSVNVSAWVRRLVRNGGSKPSSPTGSQTDEPDDAPILAPPAAPTEPDDDRTPDPQKALIDGWKPRQIDGGVWASVLDGAAGGRPPRERPPPRHADPSSPTAAATPGSRPLRPSSAEATSKSWSPRPAGRGR